MPHKHIFALIHILAIRSIFIAPFAPTLASSTYVCFLVSFWPDNVRAIARITST